MEFINVKLSDIGEVVGGSTPSTKNPDNYDGDIAWITPKDLAGYNKVYISRGERNITESGFKSCSTKMLPKNSVLFSSRAPIGYVAISENDLCTNQGFKSIIPNEKIDYKFLYYLVKHNKDYIASKGSGSTFKEVSGSVMKGIELSIPKEISDQRRISKVLFDIDKKIELNNEINNNLYEIADNLINEAFINNESIKLNEIINFIKGKKPSNISKEYKQGYEKYLTIACLNNQENMYADPIKMLLTESDILMVMDGASSGDVYFSDKGIVGSTLSKIEICNEDYISEYVFFALKRLVNAIQEKTTGSAIPHTDKVFVGNLEIPKLDMEEQLKYKSLIAKIIENNKQNITLSNLRDTLLPRLMNGEIDLDNIEI